MPELFSAPGAQKFIKHRASFPNGADIPRRDNNNKINMQNIPHVRQTVIMLRRPRKQRRRLTEHHIQVGR